MITVKVVVMENSLDSALTFFQDLAWFATRIARDCEAAYAELQCRETVAPEEVERHARKLVVELKQQVYQFLRHLVTGESTL